MASFFRARVFRACSRFRSRSSATRSSAVRLTPGGASGRARRRDAGFLAAAADGPSDSPSDSSSLAAAATVAAAPAAGAPAAAAAAAGSRGGGAPAKAGGVGVAGNASVGGNQPTAKPGNVAGRRSG